MGRVEYSPLFETRRCRGRFIYRSFAISLFVAICFIWHYRFSHITKGEDGNWAWLGMLASELWFGFYWVLTQALRWNLVFRQPFKNRLSQRYCYLLTVYFYFLYHFFPPHFFFKYFWLL